MSNISPSDGGYQYLHRKLSDLEEEIKADGERTRKNYQERNEKLEQSYLESSRENTQRSEAAAEELREASRDAVLRERAQSREDIQKVKEQTYDRFGRASAQNTAETDYLKKQLTAKGAENGRDRAKTDESSEARLRSLARDQKAKEQDAIQAMTESHRQETAGLREQVRDISDHERQYAKGFAQGLHDGVADRENEYRGENQIQRDAYERQIKAQKLKMDDRDRLSNESHGRTLREKDQGYTEMIRKMNLEQELTKKELVQNFDVNQKQFEVRNKKDQALAQKVLESQSQRADATRTALLESQAQSYREAMTRQKATDSLQIKALHDELQRKQTSTNVSEISPAAEEQVRNDTIARFDQTHAAEKARDKETNESLRNGYQQRLTETVLDSQDKQTVQAQNHAFERDTDRRMFNEHVTELEKSKTTAIYKKAHESDTEAEHLQKNYAQALSMQRRSYEDLLNTHKTDASNKHGMLKQESGFALRQAQRDFVNKQNELVKDYNKRLYDQSFEFKTQMEDMKTEHQRELRAKQKEAVNSDETLKKTYEQKIAMMEQQQKERERLIAQGYEEQLDQVKRSNALLISKKS